MLSSWEVQCGKVFCTIQLGEDVLNLGHGPDKISGDFVQGSIIAYDEFSTITLRYYYDWSSPAGVTTACHFHI